MRGALLALLGVLWVAPPALGQTVLGQAAPGQAAPGQRGRQSPPAERGAVVLNELGVAIRELYAVPAGQREAGPDRLGADTLPPGASLRLSLGRSQPCVFNFRAVLPDGTAQERREVNLCRQPRVVFGDPGAPQRDASVVNETDLPVREIYAYPPGAGSRGPDWLGADIVAAGATFHLRLGRTRDCAFDVTAVFGDGSEETRRRLNLCRNPRVVFGDAALPWREVSVRNGSGRAMRSLHAVPAGQGAEDSWGADRLGADIVPDGGVFPLRLRLRGCAVDLRAVYEDDGAEEKRGLDVCGAGTVLFDGSGVPRPPEIRLLLVNRHAAAVEEVYVSAASERDWGPDRLGAVLERGATQSLAVAVDCTADLRIVFPNGAAEERRELDLCETGTVVLRPGWTVADRPDDGSAPPADPRPGSVRLRNRARVPIVELYVDAPGAPLGPDRLGRNVLGARETLDLAPPEPGACAAVLRAVFRDGREVLREPFDLCQGKEVSLP